MSGGLLGRAPLPGTSHLRHLATMNSMKHLSPKSWHWRLDRGHRSSETLASPQDWTTSASRDDWANPVPRQDSTMPASRDDWTTPASPQNWATSASRDDWATSASRQDWATLIPRRGWGCWPSSSGTHQSQ